MAADAYMVLRHDCEAHHHNYELWGPFASVEQADVWIDQHDADMPSDGGYAFAAILPAVLPNDDLRRPESFHDDDW